MHRTRHYFVLAVFISFLSISAFARAEPYELSEHDITEPKAISSSTVSLFGVKLGDPEGKAVETLETLVNRKALGIKVEQEATFIFLLDQRKPTGPVYGFRTAKSTCCSSITVLPTGQGESFAMCSIAKVLTTSESYWAKKSMAMRT
jgi:hypothetical protein